ncbi:hypothetical protein GJAV_G00157230 [Gymnothorax javanicus]|nr:hypothetical protein GJAV_G00157230 [Gymnothorax javanicus]
MDGMEFICRPHKKPAIQLSTDDEEDREYGFDGMTSDEVQEVLSVVEGDQPSSPSNTELIHVLPDANSDFSSHSSSLAVSLSAPPIATTSNTSTSVTDLLTNDVCPTLLDLDTLQLTSSAPVTHAPTPLTPVPSSACTPLSLSPTTRPNLTIFQEDGTGSLRHDTDLLSSIGHLHSRLDMIFQFMQRLEAKIDSTTTPQPTPKACSTVSTQTDVDSVAAVPESDVQDPPPTALPDLPTPIPPEPSTPAFTDRRIWGLRPIQLETVTPEHLQHLVSTIGETAVPSDKLDLTLERLTSLRNRSHGPGHFAKNIVYAAFSLKELYKKNTFGKNCGKGKRKTAINPQKMTEVMNVVRLHYDDENLEKCVATAVNSGLRHLWNKKLNLPWLTLETLI